SAQSSTNVANKSDLGATLTVNADGTVKYDPTTSSTIQAAPAGQLTVDTFTYTTTTLAGVTSKATVTVTVASGSVVDLNNGAFTLNGVPGTANNLTVSND